MRYPIVNKDDVKAPKSQYRVIGVDVEEASGSTYLVGDFQELDTANRVAAERAGVGSPVYIYDDSGQVLARLGSWH